MKLQQLEYFCAVVEEKSFSGASRKLHVSQPPISRQIALLEEEFDTQLFIRHNKGISLTQTGVDLYKESRLLMQAVENMASNIRNIDSGLMGSLKVGMVYSVTPYALDYLKCYHVKYPGVELKVNIDTPQSLVEQLRIGDIHAAFLRSGATGQYGFHEKILSEDPLKLIVTRELDPAPELEEVPIELLRNAPFCLLRSDDIWGYSNYLSDVCLKNGFRPRIVCQCYSTHIAVQMILAGFGMSFLPQSIVDTLPGSGLYAKSIKGLDASSSSILVWDEKTLMNPCGRLFIER